MLLVAQAPGLLEFRRGGTSLQAVDFAGRRLEAELTYPIFSPRITRLPPGLFVPRAVLNGAPLLALFAGPLIDGAAQTMRISVPVSLA
jgi:hypothetical protein